MEIFLITLVVAAVGGRLIRWGLGRAGIMPTMEEARAIKQKATRLGWEAERLKSELDSLAIDAGSVNPETFMPSVGDFLLAAEDEPLFVNNKRCRKALEAIRRKLGKDFGFDETSFALMREKARARADKKRRKSEKRIAPKAQRVLARR